MDEIVSKSEFQIADEAMAAIYGTDFADALRAMGNSEGLVAYAQFADAFARRMTMIMERLPESDHIELNLINERAEKGLSDNARSLLDIARRAMDKIVTDNQLGVDQKNHLIVPEFIRELDYRIRDANDSDRYAADYKAITQQTR